MIFAFYLDVVYHGKPRWIPVGFLESEKDLARQPDGMYAVYDCSEGSASAKKMPDSTNPLPETLTFKRLRVSKTPQVEPTVEAP